MKIKLSVEEASLLMQHVKGKGGFQSHIRRLQAGFKPIYSEVMLSQKDAETIKFL